MAGVPMHDATLSPVGPHLLHYLHQETDATWTISASELGEAFPLTTSGGASLGFLCMQYEGDASRYQAIGRAVATSIAAIVEAESRTPAVIDGGAMLGRLDEPSADGRVVAYFQPIVHLSSGEVVAIEALARMQTADGVLGPEAFLEAYSTGASMLELFDRMLDEAVHFLADFRHRLPDLSAAINLEFAGIPEHGLAELITSRLEQCQIDPESLSIELNERVAYQLSDAAVAELGRVVSLGVKLLLDDVPSSFDALARLGSVKVSGAKLDRRYVKQLAGSEQDAAAVQAILQRAADAGIELIAEGVETQHQCDALVRMGCTFGQGYLFAVPQPASSLAVVLDAPLVTSW